MMGGAPVDRGWSWMILVGSFTCSFFVIGGFKSSGIIFLHVLEMFGASRSLTAWMLGLMSFGLALWAPVSNAMGVRYGYRAVVMLGGLVMSLAYLLAAYAPNIYFVVIILGVLVGFGNGVLYTPSMIMVGQYFNKHRSLAMGVTAAGGSFGSLTIPFLVRALLDNFGYRGCMLVYSAFCLHAVVAGALYRPQSFYDRKSRKTSVKPENDMIRTENAMIRKESIQKPADGPERDDLRTPSQSMNSLIFRESIQLSLTSTPMNALDKLEKLDSLANIDEDTVLEHGPEMHDDVDNEDVQCISYQVHYDSDGSIHIMKTDEPQGVNGESLIKSTFPRLANNAASDINLENLIQPQKQNPWTKCLFDCFEPFRSMFDREMLSTCVYWVYFFATCISNSGYMDQFLFIPPYGQEMGISKINSAFILSMAGVADLIGRVSGGLLNNFKFVKIHIFSSVTLFTVATSILITLRFPSYTSLLCHGILLGLFGGMYIAMFPIVLVQLIGIAKFPQSFAFTMLGVGLWNLPLPTILGKISEVTGSYKICYIILNSILLLGSLLFLIMPRVKQCDDLRVQRRHQSQAEEFNQPEPATQPQCEETSTIVIESPTSNETKVSELTSA